MIVGQDLDCSTLITSREGQPQILVDAITSEKIDNDFQTLFDCIPKGGEVMFTIPEISINKSVVLHKPISISSAMRNAANKIEIKEAVMECSDNGLFDIR